MWQRVSPSAQDTAEVQLLLPLQIAWVKKAAWEQRAEHPNIQRHPGGTALPCPVPVPGPCRCTAESHHKTSYGETNSSSWRTLRGALCSVGVAPGHADTTLPHSSTPQILLPPGHSQGQQGSSKPGKGSRHCSPAGTFVAAQTHARGREAPAECSHTPAPTGALQQREGNVLPPVLNYSQVTHCSNNNR